MSDLRKKTMEEIEMWHEHNDATWERRINKLRNKNLDEIHACRKSLLSMPYARFRAKKMIYLDKMEAYVEKHAWMPWSYRQMLGVWFYSENAADAVMFDEFLPMS